MIGWIIFAFIWIAFDCIAARFAIKAKETDWWSFVLVGLIPIVGAIFSIGVYSKVISDNERKVQ